MVHNEVSYLQKYIWLDQKLDLLSPKYNIGEYSILNGEINENVFKDAIRTMVDSNDVFLFLFKELKGIPVFRCERSVSMDEYFTLSLAKNEKAAINMIKADFSKPFNLESEDKLFRIWLIRINNSKFFWYIKLHHLIADGFSFHLIFNKVNTIYRELSLNDFQSKSVEINQYSFKKYIEWEKEYRLSNYFKRSKEFWLQKYESPVPLLFTNIVVR